MASSSWARSQQLLPLLAWRGDKAVPVASPPAAQWLVEGASSTVAGAAGGKALGQKGCVLGTQGHQVSPAMVLVWHHLVVPQHEGGLRSGLQEYGIVVSILDDGIEKNHPDLPGNYDPGASFKVNDQDPDPQPQYTQMNDNWHGTWCAGQETKVTNNSICGIGMVYND